jgi:hypothetical protein
MRFPTVFYDECLYFSYARYFAGVSHLPNLQGGASGHFGYAMSLVPVFWLTHSFYRQYQLILVINSFFISSSYFCLYFLLSKLADVPRRACMAIAFFTCLYPSFLLFSNSVITENALVPVTLLIPVALLLLIERPTMGRALLMGVSVGMAYLIHARSVILVLTTAVLLLSMAVVRRLRWHVAATALVTMAYFYIFTQVGYKHLSELVGGNQARIVPTLAHLVSARGVQEFLMVFVGQGVYLLQTTYCLYFAGWAYLWLVAWRTPQSSGAARKIVCGFLFATSLAVAVISAIFISQLDPYSRVDHLLIGRYNEGPAAVFIAFSLAFAYSTAGNVLRRRVFWKCMMAGALVLVAGTLVVSPFVQRLGMCSINALANVAMVLVTGSRDLTRVTLLVLLMSAASAFAMRRWRQWGIALVPILFFLSGAYTFMRCYSQRGTPPGGHPTVLASRIAGAGGVATVSYDMAAWNAFSYSSYQLLLPNTRFVQFHGDRGEEPKSAVVIASASWKDGTRLGYARVDRESGFDQAIWASSPALLAKIAGSRSFVNTEVGSLIIPGIQTEGLDPVEGDGTTRYRWTNGNAKIRVPLQPQERASRLYADFSAFEKTKTVVSVNGAKVLITDVGPGHFFRAVALTGTEKGGTINIEIRSDTFRAPPPNVRTLGVEVHSIKVLQ